MKKVGIIGGGNMGTAILAGIKKHYAVRVCEKENKKALKIRRRFVVKTSDLLQVIKESQVIILAVKPQDFSFILEEIQVCLKTEKLFISIAAGITTSFIEKQLGSQAKVVRAMPNLPAMIGEGMTALCQGRRAKRRDLLLAQEIFDHIGKTVLLTEKDLDAVTAVSGSGPAYVFYFVECMEKAAKKLGLRGSAAQALIQQTLKGTIHLLDVHRGQAALLRKRVTSKAGTTEAALKVLMKGGFEKLIINALWAAKARAGKLSR